MSVTISEAQTAVEAFFTRNNYTYTFDEEQNAYRTRFDLPASKLSTIDITILFTPMPDAPDNCRRITSLARTAMKPQESIRPLVSEFLTRVNYTLAIGNFELDFTGGDVRYKVCVNTVDELPGQSAIDDLVDIPVDMFNKYGDGLIAVIMELASPKLALELCERERK